MHWTTRDEIMAMEWKIHYIWLNVGCSGWSCHNSECPGHDQVRIAGAIKTLDHGEVFDLPRGLFTRGAWRWLQSQR